MLAVDFSKSKSVKVGGIIAELYYIVFIDESEVFLGDAGIVVGCI